MRNRRRLAIIAGIVVIVFVIFTVGATLVLNIQPKQVGPISQVEYSQTKAVLGWDDSTAPTTDAAQLDALHSVLVKDGWTPGSASARQNNGCSGGLGSKLAISFVDGSTAQLEVYQCGSDSDALTDDLTGLVTTWRNGNA